MASAWSTCTPWCTVRPPQNCPSTNRRSRPCSTKSWEDLMARQDADLLIHNGRIATQDDRRSMAEAAAIRDGRFTAVGTDKEVMAHRGAHTEVIDLNRRAV